MTRPAKLFLPIGTGKWYYAQQERACERRPGIFGRECFRNHPDRRQKNPHELNREGGRKNQNGLLPAAGDQQADGAHAGEGNGGGFRRRCRRQSVDQITKEKVRQTRR